MTQHDTQHQQNQSRDASLTIVAPATPIGRGGVGIVRVSGSQAVAITKKIAPIFEKKALKPRFAHFSQLFDPQQHLIDEALVIFFPNPNSFTGEDVVEFHCHGGPVVLNLLVEAVLYYGAVMAEPGEFSKRAFLNNKIDLTQAEAIADLIDSTSKSAARNAVQSLQGKFSQKVSSISEKITYLRTFVEASIDFSDEEIDVLGDQALQARVLELQAEVEAVLKQARQGVILRDGVKLSLLGLPNVGKSSLLNALAGNDVAIVTQVAGTTRDILREYIHLDGIPVHISDTAGLRKSDDSIESEGVRRAIAEVSKADYLLLVVDAKSYQKAVDEKGFDLQHFWPSLLENPPEPDRCLVVVNKIDQTDDRPRREAYNGNSVLFVSAKFDQGLNLIAEEIKRLVGYQQEGEFSARQRHIDILLRVQSLVERAKEQLCSQSAPELFAEDLRVAHDELGKITGQFSVDDLLGEIFSSFCIGK